MGIVAQGRLRYLRFDSQGEAHAEVVDQDEDWISEPVLWMQTWFHLGALSAVKECDLLLVRPLEFSDIICKNPVASGVAFTYAERYFDWIESVDIEELSDISQGDQVAQMHEEFMGLEPARKSVGCWMPIPSLPTNAV